jgi:hypothetical protein
MDKIMMEWKRYSMILPDLSNKYRFEKKKEEGIERLVLCGRGYLFLQRQMTEEIFTVGCFRFCKGLFFSVCLTYSRKQLIYCR